MTNTGSSAGAYLRYANEPQRLDAWSGRGHAGSEQLWSRSQELLRLLGKEGNPDHADARAVVDLCRQLHAASREAASARRCDARPSEWEDRLFAIAGCIESLPIYVLRAWDRNALSEINDVLSQYVLSSRRCACASRVLTQTMESASESALTAAPHGSAPWLEHGRRRQWTSDSDVVPTATEKVKRPRLEARYPVTDAHFGDADPRFVAAHEPEQMDSGPVRPITVRSLSNEQRSELKAWIKTFRPFRERKLKGVGVEWSGIARHTTTIRSLFASDDPQDDSLRMSIRSHTGKAIKDWLALNLEGLGKIASTVQNVGNGLISILTNNVLSGDPQLVEAVTKTCNALTLCDMDARGIANAGSFLRVALRARPSVLTEQADRETFELACVRLLGLIGGQTCANADARTIANVGNFLKALLESQPAILNKAAEIEALRLACFRLTKLIGAQEFTNPDNQAIANVANFLRTTLEAYPALQRKEMDSAVPWYAWVRMIGVIGGWAFTNANSRHIANVGNFLKATLELESQPTLLKEETVRAALRRACIRLIDLIGEETFTNTNTQYIASLGDSLRARLEG